MVTRDRTRLIDGVIPNLLRDFFPQFFHYFSFKRHNASFDILDKIPEMVYNKKWIFTLRSAGREINKTYGQI